MLSLTRILNSVIYDVLHHGIRTFLFVMPCFTRLGLLSILEIGTYKSIDIDSAFENCVISCKKSLFRNPRLMMRFIYRFFNF